MTRPAPTGGSSGAGAGPSGRKQPLSILMLMLDGVGLGPEDPVRNPLVAVRMPRLTDLLGGAPLTDTLAPFDGERCSFQPVDANLGVDGEPQSATGQATILTGENVARRIKTHYGPKPNRRIAAILRRHTLVRRLAEAGLRSTLWNAYPPAYFQSIRSGRRLCSAIPMAFALAGAPLRSDRDLLAGQALSADFTGAGWRSRLGYMQAPVYPPHEAGLRLAELAAGYAFSVVDHWPTDFAGHRADMAAAAELLQTLDAVIGGLLDSPHIGSLLVIITSDHGNMEDFAERGHTRNPVPALLFGAPAIRRGLTPSLRSLADIAPAIFAALTA